jgi:hypothetical protein
MRARRDCKAGAALPLADGCALAEALAVAPEMGAVYVVGARGLQCLCVPSGLVPHTHTDIS